MRTRLDTGCDHDHDIRLFLVLILILILRPRGLFAQVHGKKV